MNQFYIILLAVFFYSNVRAQQAYFVDGYHGWNIWALPGEVENSIYSRPAIYASGLADLFGDRTGNLGYCLCTTPEAYQHFKKLVASRQVEFYES